MRFELFCLALVSLTGCDAPPIDHGSQAAITACRQDVDRVYLKQNRAVLSQRDTVDSPFSSVGITGITSAGLGEDYGRDQAFDRCLAQSAPSGRGTFASGVNGTAGSGMSHTLLPNISPSLAP